MGRSLLKTFHIAVPDFRRQLRKTWDHPFSVSNGDNGHTMADEESPLLVNPYGRTGTARSGSTMRQVFLDRRHTPGMESENTMVRYMASAFNVLKATLLSSKFGHSDRPTRRKSHADIHV